MYKVEIEDLEDIVDFLDKIIKTTKDLHLDSRGVKDRLKAIKLSNMIKSKYTQKKPHYEDSHN